MCELDAFIYLFVYFLKSSFIVFLCSQTTIFIESTYGVCLFSIFVVGVFSKPAAPLIKYLYNNMLRKRQKFCWCYASVNCIIKIRFGNEIYSQESNSS